MNRDLSAEKVGLVSNHDLKGRRCRKIPYRAKLLDLRHWLLAKWSGNSVKINRFKDKKSGGRNLFAAIREERT